MRAIVQYNGLLANPAYSSLQTNRNLNFDFLITYLVHPGTAVYVGYNSNLENFIPGLCTPAPGSLVGCDPNGNGLVHGSRLINVGRVVFGNVSYVCRRHGALPLGRALNGNGGHSFFVCTRLV